MNLGNKWKWIFIALLLFPLAALSDEYHLKFVRNPSVQIEGLTWDSTENTQSPKLQEGSDDSETQGVIREFVTLHGKVTDINQRLLLLDKVIPLKEDGTFDVEVGINQQVNLFTLNIIDALGKVGTEVDSIEFPNFDKFHQEQSLAQRKKNRNFFVSSGVGAGFFFFQQSDQQSFSELMMAVKGTLEYLIGARWNLEANAFYAGLMLQNYSSGMSLDELGGSLSLAYFLTPRTSPWCFSMSTGFYLTTTFSAPDDFGYANLLGPQFSFRLSKSMSGGQQVFTYLKYALFLNSDSLFTGTNAETTLGIGYWFEPMKNGNAIGVLLDFTYLNLSLGGESLSLGSTTLGFNYRF